MIKLELTSDILSQHKKYYKDIILGKLKPDGIEIFKNSEQIALDTLSNSNKDEIIDAHNEFMTFCKNKWETLAVGDPKQLREIMQEVEKNHSLVAEMISKKINVGKKDASPTYSLMLLKKFGYSSFSKKENKDMIYKAVIAKAYIKINKKNDGYKKLYYKYFEEAALEIFPSYKKSKTDLSANDFKKRLHRVAYISHNIIGKFNSIDSSLLNFKWCAYKFLLIFPIRVCPYCNRQYIAPILTNSGVMRADLDHFYSKEKYPYLSMSIYNLVPSCKFCNSSLKGSKEFDENAISPYEDSYNSHFTFYYNKTNKEIAIRNQEKLSDDIKSYLEMFKIRELYNYHINQAQELMDKKQMFGKESINFLMKTGVFSSKTQLKELIYGYTSDESKINDEAFLKFRRDILKQIGVARNIDPKILSELKSIKKK